jgi:polyhydroxyalkanoate synthesis regulator phasin
MTNTEDLLYQAAKAMAEAQQRIEELEAQIVELRAEMQRRQTCCNCN